MSQVAEKFVALNKKQAEVAIRAFEIGFGAWEMLLRLNLEATKSLLHEGLANIPALAGAGEMANLSEWTGQFRAGADKFSGYSRNVYEIAGQASSDMGDLLEQTCLVLIRKSWNGSMKCLNPLRSRSRRPLQPPRKQRWRMPGRLLKGFRRLSEGPPDTRMPVCGRPQRRRQRP